MNLIELLQNEMKKQKIDAYIIPTSDFHNSEYISDHFKSREYMTGFTGSAGTLLVFKGKGYLWVDGRYHIQASKQTEGQAISIMKMGNPGVSTINEFLSNNLKDNDTLGFDGRLLNAKMVTSLRKSLPNIKFIFDKDLVDAVWPNRPDLPYSLIYNVSKFYYGTNYSAKIANVRVKMNELNADVHIISSLDDQAWLYNLRANDIPHTPVFLAFTVITKNQNILFVDTTKVDLTVEEYLHNNDITIKPYNEIYNYAKSLKHKNILMNLNTINYLLYETVVNNNKIIDAEDPTHLMKAIKNKNEIKHIKNAHIKDGVAFTKFMYYTKKSYESKQSISEISLGSYLDKLRAKSKGFIDVSFDTICAYKDHGAIIHYRSTDSTNYKIDESGFLLVDSGGHYLDGTTDITRTIALGRISDQMKEHFTTVLKSLIALSEATFLKGCTGQNLDILARNPIWQLLLDYKCGTGHGVGNLLSIHEGPNYFRWQKPSAAFEPGMITSNEPGIYLEGKYGIRLENELLCIEKTANEFGEFLGFETITYAPIDLDAVKTTLLTKYEKEWLNNYHQLVFDTLSPHLKKDEVEWLEKYTRKI